MHRTSGRNGWDVRGLRTAVLSLSRALTFGLAAAAPITSRDHHDNEPEAEGGALWVLYVVSMVLVLLGGAFAGLTIALMGQDEIYLQVISLDPEEPQRKNAKRVHDLLNKGKHWVLVTLLLSNVIVNETLPVVLDRCFGGGIAAVVGSTVLIVIFGEILPQSICVRYGLQIGGYMSKPVLVLMWLMAIVAWPTAKLLDWLLGADHGTVYKKSGLKTLVTLHKSLGEVDERLNQDEVTIISAVLDLKHKAVDEVMTPMDDVFVMSEDTVLDEKTIDQILDAGYSRIPIHQAGNPTNFVGMLLVKILITYDPEDGKRVKDFSLATLPETRAETSCLDLINFFQEGKSHMVLISEFPGEDHGALGVVTLEDVIEELIGEEIIDESDVYVDIHKAIRRTHPAPKARAHRIHAEEGQNGHSHDKRPSLSHTENLSQSPKVATLLMRRSSSGQDGHQVHTKVPVKANLDEIRDHFKHLGPSNPASNPKTTRVSAMKIKPGAANQQKNGSADTYAIVENPREGIESGEGADEVNERTSLLRPKDGIQALQYQGATNNTDVPQKLSVYTDGSGDDDKTKVIAPSDEPSPTDSNGTDPIGRQKRYVRSGSITENIIETGGVRKVVLEANSSSSESDGEQAENKGSAAAAPSEGDGAASGSQGGGKKKNRRKKRKGGK